VGRHLGGPASTSVGLAGRLRRLAESGAHPLVVAAGIQRGEESRARASQLSLPRSAARSATVRPVSGYRQHTSASAACSPARARIACAACLSDPTRASCTWTACPKPVAPFSVESSPMKPRVHAKGTRISVAPATPAVRTRDCVSFNEPSLLTMKASPAPCAPPCGILVRAMKACARRHGGSGSWQGLRILGPDQLQRPCGNHFTTLAKLESDSGTVNGANLPWTRGAHRATVWANPFPQVSTSAVPARK
jgi:hypothetical protein